MSNNLERASELIKNFKQVSVDVSNEMQRSFNLFDYLHTIVQSLHPELRYCRHKIEIVGDEDLLVESYPGALSQIITNLIMNSFYHAFTAEEQGRIVIHTACKDKQAVLSYSDDGSGMSAEIMAEVFEPFFTTRRELGGSGLGMFIVYNLVTQTLDGEVSCSSNPGQGTTFIISFPIKTQ